jgi:hypothetical protein
MIPVGVNSALTAETTYYYRLSCGGDQRQYELDGLTPLSVTTLATLSSTRTISVTLNRSGSTTLEYGTAYSRATDTISSGGTDVQSCSGSCTFSFTANRGDIYYYRIQGEGSVPQVVAVQ